MTAGSAGHAADGAPSVREIKDRLTERGVPLKEDGTVVD